MEEREKMEREKMEGSHKQVEKKDNFDKYFLRPFPSQLLSKSLSY